MSQHEEKIAVACRGELPLQYDEDHAVTLFIETEDGEVYQFKLGGPQARQLREDICSGTQSGFPSTVKKR